MFDVRHVRVTMGVFCSKLTFHAGPLLLGYFDSDSDVKQEKEDIGNWNSLPKHRDEDQVRLDVDRSFIYYPNGGS